MVRLHPDVTDESAEIHGNCWNIRFPKHGFQTRYFKKLVMHTFHLFAPPSTPGSFPRDDQEPHGSQRSHSRIDVALGTQRA